MAVAVRVECSSSW